MNSILSVYLRLITMTAAIAASSCSNESTTPPVDVPDAVSGAWVWTIAPLGCDVIEGVLSSPQDIRITQTGFDVSAVFDDSAGNRVQITGQLVDEMWNATLRVVRADGRVIVASMQLSLTTSDIEDVLGGPINITSDSAELCAPDTEATVRVRRDNNPSEDAVFSACGLVDIVVAMDTSGSMDDEAGAVCTQLDAVVARMQARGLDDVRAFKWGIIQDGDDPEFVDTGEFFCLDNHVKRVFGDPVVPGTTDDRLTTVDLEGDEDWADAVSIVAHLGSENRNPGFQWRSDALKIIVPISDEGPSQGDPSDEPDDVAAIDNAIVQATQNEVIVSPLIANDAEPTTAELGRKLAVETGGQAFRTTDPDLDLGEILYDLVFVACGGELPAPPQPANVGPTTLIAADAQGGLYAFGSDSEREVKLADLTFEGTTGSPFVEAMVFNERVSALWVGVQNADFEATNIVFSVGPDGRTTRLDTNDEDHFRDFAQARTSQAILVTDDDDDLYILNNTSGRASEYTDDVGVIAETGNALTFADDDLLLASGQTMWKLDPFSGQATLVGQLSVLDPPAELRCVRNRIDDDSAIRRAGVRDGCGVAVGRGRDLAGHGRQDYGPSHFGDRDQRSDGRSRVGPRRLLPLSAGRGGAPKRRRLTARLRGPSSTRTALRPSVVDA